MPLAIRAKGVAVSPNLRVYVRDRLGRKLRKFVPTIERASVRFTDVNGPRGGIDSLCRIKVVLSGLPSVVVQDLGDRPFESFDRAADATERAVRRSIERRQRQGRSAMRGNRGAKTVRKSATTSSKAGKRKKRQPLPPPHDGSLIGPRVGRSAANLARAAARPEKERRDVPVDTALPGTSATDRRAGGSSTAARNTKRNTAKLTAALEDSASERPSRKSSRGSLNRSKRDSNLRRRQTRKVSSSKARAQKDAV